MYCLERAAQLAWAQPHHLLYITQELSSDAMIMVQDFKQLWDMPNTYAPQARPGAGLDSARRSSGDAGKVKQVRMQISTARC